MVSLVKFNYWFKFYVSIITGSGIVAIFFYKGLTRNPDRDTKYEHRECGVGGGLKPSSIFLIMFLLLTFLRFGRVFFVNFPLICFFISNKVV